MPRSPGRLTPKSLLMLAGAWHTPATIEAHFDGAIETIATNLRNLTNDVGPFNQELEALIRPRLEARRKTAEATKADHSCTEISSSEKRRRAADLISSLNGQSHAAPKPTARATTTKPEQEYTLDETDYQEILRICTSMSLVMERSPTVFEHAEEEHIRVHYLVQLNGRVSRGRDGRNFQSYRQNRYPHPTSRQEYLRSRVQILGTATAN